MVSIPLSHSFYLSVSVSVSDSLHFFLSLLFSLSQHSPDSERQASKSSKLAPWWPWLHAVWRGFSEKHLWHASRRACVQGHKASPPPPMPLGVIAQQAQEEEGSMYEANVCSPPFLSIPSLPGTPPTPSPRARASSWAFQRAKAAVNEICWTDAKSFPQKNCALDSCELGGNHASVCCSVLQCVAVCFSLFQCIAVCALESCALCDNHVKCPWNSWVNSRRAFDLSRFVRLFHKRALKCQGAHSSQLLIQCMQA